MTAAHVESHFGPWTVADLLALPESGTRYELVDGALIMSPPPSVPHQRGSGRLYRLLADAAPPEVEVLEAVGVRCGGEQLLVPDLVVVNADAARSATDLLAARDVLLVVEIVSPGSRTRDRTEKPYLYAEAGIPGFWRVETDEHRGRTEPLPLVVVHELTGLGEYTVTATVGAGSALRADEPFPVEFDPATLV